jgi:site-specific DNA-methyltransferase (adenine-specific)
VWLDIPPVRHASTKRREANELSTKLLQRVLEISTEPGDLVLDPFGGSGTTYAVAEQMKRRWFGVEIGDTDPIVRRLKGEPTNIMPKNLGDSGKGSRHNVALSEMVQPIAPTRVEEGRSKSTTLPAN